MTASARAMLLALASLVVGCGDDDGGTPTDAGADAGRADAGVDGGGGLVVAPPALPVFTPCPDGWREVAPSGEGLPVACDPYPESGPGDCGSGEAHFPGTPGCAPVGTACPADGWPADLPTDATVVYVDVDAAPGGDGSRASPHATLGDALAAAPEDAIIAVAPGMYRENVSLSRPVTVWGACPDVRIGGFGFAFSVRDVRAEIRNLSVWGVSSAFTLDTGTDLVVRDAVIDTTLQEFVQAHEGGSVALENVSVRGAGRGIVHSGAGRIALRRVELRGGRLPILLVQGAEVVLEDVAVLGAAVGTLFEAVIIANQSTVSIDRFYARDLERSRVQVGGGTFRMRDAVLEGATTTPMVASDLGILAHERAAVVLDRVRLSTLNGLGAGAIQEGTTLTITDSWIRDPRIISETLRAQALELGLGASGSADRFLATGCRGACILVTDAATTLTLGDATITDVTEGLDERNGRALQAQSGALVMGERVAVARAREVAMLVADAELRVADLTITDTRETACAPTCDSAGIGLGAYIGGVATVTRFRIADNVLAGVQVAEDGAMDLADGVISGHLVGANVQVAGYDVARLSVRVRYESNGTNLDSTELPVPPPTLGL